MSEASTPVEVFCCYSRADEFWLRKLESHLSLLQRQGLITLWHDRLIPPGTNWADTIDQHLETASVILLLVSSDFLASDYCYSIEMKRALEREEAGEARVVPILVREVSWKEAPFAHLQALPTDAKPVASWRDKERALADVVTGVRRVIEDVPLLAASAPRTILPKIWNVPYSRNPFFLGRDAELALVRQHLQEGQTTALSQPQAISGLGGIGKTQLALEYAYRYHQDYEAVLWARAESEETLISSYLTLATLLRLPEREAKEPEIIIADVKAWLQTHQKWLLILDNADELEVLPPFLPPSPGGHILLTTRAWDMQRLATRLEVVPLSDEQGARLLLMRAGLLTEEAQWWQLSPQERTPAILLTQELGGLPLALDQAGAYLEATGISVEEYHQLYQAHRSRLLQERRSHVHDHPQGVTTTWSLSFEHVQERNVVAADLLRFCAYCAPDAIAEEILTTDPSVLGPRLAPVGEDAFQRNQAIEALRAYSLVRRDPREKTLSVHRLVQAVIQETLEAAEQQMWAERALRAISVAFPDPEPGTLAQCERLLLQALRATDLIETSQFTGWEATSLLDASASYLRYRARYGEAEPLYLRALRICEQTLEPDHPRVASSLNNLALLYREQGRYAEAEPLYLRALRICEQTLGPDHPDVAYPLNNLAELYREQGRYAEAEPLYLRALTIREQTLEPDHPDVAYPLTNLAELYREQDKNAEAEPLFQRALRIREQTLGPDHPRVASSLNGLANLYQAQGKDAKAEPLYLRALTIHEQTLGLDHPHVAYPLHNLAELYREQGRYAEAEPLYWRALHIWEQTLGLDHPHVAYLLNGLAELYREQGKDAEAEPLYWHALHIMEQTPGPDHPNVAHPLNGLANLYRDQGKDAEAEQLYLRVLRIREQQRGPDHQEMADAMHDLAQLREAQDNSEEAKSLYTRALAIREQVFEAHHSKTTETRTRLMVLLHAMGQHEEATQLERTQSEL